MAVFLIALGDYLGLGLRGILYLILILYSTSLITIYGSRKGTTGRSTKPGRSIRDFWRIMGGGGLGGFIGFLIFFRLLSVHMGAIGLVTAFGITSSDTWASSIGILSKRKPLMIIPPWHHVDGGVSGAISLLGETFGVIGGLTSLVFADISGLLEGNNLIELLLVLAVIILGEKLDSVLGASIQGSYYCKRCNLTTDDAVHDCGEMATIIRGSRLITNSTVNLLTTITGVIIALLLIR